MASYYPQVPDFFIEPPTTPPLKIELKHICSKCGGEVTGITCNNLSCVIDDITPRDPPKYGYLK
jgi:hypothetical protein